jgi:hypothetical protein
MIKNVLLLSFITACAHQPAASTGAVALDAVSVMVSGRTFHGAALSRFDSRRSLLWYTLLYTGEPADLGEIRRTYVPQLAFAEGGDTITAFQLSGRALFVLPDTIRAASEKAARAELVGTIAPKKLASAYPAVPVLPKDEISVDLYDALGYDFADGTFHQPPQTELLSVHFARSEWRLRIRNRRGEQRTLRLDRHFQPLNRKSPQ